MKIRYFKPKEWLLYLIRQACVLLDHPFKKIGNWATEELNKSYYGNYKEEWIKKYA